MSAFLTKKAGLSPFFSFRRPGQSLLLALVILSLFVAPLGAVNTGSLTRDAPLDPGPTNGDVGIPEDPMYGARRSPVGEIAEEMQRRNGGKNEELTVPVSSSSVPGDGHRLLRRERI